MSECVRHLCHYAGREVFAPGRKGQEATTTGKQEAGRTFDKTPRSDSDSDWIKVLQNLIRANSHPLEATRRQWAADGEVRNVLVKYNKNGEGSN